MKVLSYLEELEKRTPSVHFADTGNYTSLVEEKAGESENLTGSLIFYVFLLFTIVCVSINSRIIFAVAVNGKRTIRSAKKLMVQFSTISISFSILILFEFMGQSKVTKMFTGSSVMCRALSYFRNVIYGIFPLNAATFVYERFIGPNTPFGKFVEYKFIVGMWLISSLVNIPEILNADYTIIPNTTIGHCIHIPILDSQIASVAYELIQFLVFHAIPCLYMAHCVYRVRLKLWRIFKFQNFRRVRMLRRVFRLLFVFLSTATFALLWLPTGLITLIIKIEGYLAQEIGNRNTSLLAFTTFLQYILLCIAPLMYMLMNPDLPQMFPGFILYQGNILAERRRDWRRMATRAPRNAKESGKDIEMGMLGLERGEMGMYDERQQIPKPVESEDIPVEQDEALRPCPLISPVLSIDEIEDYALVERVKENPETTLVHN